MKVKPHPSVLTGPSRRWSLSSRLSLAINLVAVIVLIGFWLLDYRREQAIHIQDLVQQLREEAKVLSVARQVLSHAGAFQEYIDKYCHQMERHISPGHHIVVLNTSGDVVARAHERDDRILESEMSVTERDSFSVFEYLDQEYIVAGLNAVDGTRILVTQSLAPVQRVIRRQAISRAISMTVLVGMIVLTTNLVLFRWVRRPVRDLVHAVETLTRGRFECRVPEQRTQEFQILADGFNQMSASLEHNELQRRVEMERARRIQSGLLPSDSIEVAGFSVAARYIPADRVGGDYYDVIGRPDGRALFVIADVCGHGVSAALVTAMLKALIRQAAHMNCPLGEMTQMLNAELCSLFEVEGFVTCLLALGDPMSGDIQYVNCGHEPGLIVDPAKPAGPAARAARIKQSLDCTGLPLGIMREATWETGQTRLEIGDRLCFVTDGLAETLGADERMYGREGLRELIRTTTSESPRDQISTILSELERFQGHNQFPDDVTMFVLQRNGMASHTEQTRPLRREAVRQKCNT